jgi:hypothetical protein
MFSQITLGQALIPLFEDPFYCYLPIYAEMFQVVSFPEAFSQKPYMHLSSSPFEHAPPNPFIMI